MVFHQSRPSRVHPEQADYYFGRTTCAVCLSFKGRFDLDLRTAGGKRIGVRIRVHSPIKARFGGVDKVIVPQGEHVCHRDCTGYLVEENASFDIMDRKEDVWGPGHRLSVKAVWRNGITGQPVGETKDHEQQ